MSYAGQRAAAARLIAAKGGDVVFTRPNAAMARDPVTQELPSTPKVTTFKTKAIGAPPGRSWMHRNGTLITENMIELTLVPGDYVPLHTDNVRWKNKDWSVKSWVELDPDGGGTVLLQMLIEV